MDKEVVKTLNIKEFIDSELNIIGYNDEPTVGPNMDTKVGTNTTDQNMRIGHQNFDYDFLGRFGFTMWENDNKSNPLIQELAELIYNKSDSNVGEFSSLGDEDENKKAAIGIANEILSIVRKHIKDSVKKSETLSESELKSVIEDVVLKKKPSTMMKKTNIDNDILPKKLTDTIDKLSKDDKELLVKYIKDNK